MSRFVTVYKAKGSPVNINTAPVEVLLALTPEADSEYLMTRELAEEIVWVRAEEPFENISELKDRVGGMEISLYNQIQSLMTVKSSHFSADVLGETERASSRAFGVLQRGSGGEVHLVYYRGF